LKIYTHLFITNFACPDVTFQRYIKYKVDNNNKVKLWTTYWIDRWLWAVRFRVLFGHFEHVVIVNERIDCTSKSRNSAVLLMSLRWATVPEQSGPKSGGRYALFRREIGPYLTQCGWAEAYLRTKWHPNPSSRLATIDQRFKQTDNGPIA